MAEITDPRGNAVFPLTQLIIDLQKASMSRRMAADPARTAAHYGVREDHARFYITEARRCNDIWPIRESRHGKKR